MVKYSIILPLKNGGAYLKECVQSILSQTWLEFNLIVLDNNSTDGSREWLESQNDQRIQIHPSSASLSIEQNWARAVSIPKNEFITFIGHDDLLDPGYLEEMDKLIEKHPGASLYQAHFTYINAKGALVKSCIPMDEIQQGHEFLACQLTRSIDSMGTGYMMRSRDFDALGGMPLHYPNLIFADYQLWVQLSSITYKATSGKTCFKYRIHNSTSKLTNGEQYLQAFEQYVFFMHSQVQENDKIRSVVEKYGYSFLMFFCESLSHRVLKTPIQVRKIKVAGVIDKFKQYAGLLIPGQPFNPLHKIRISVAKTLDSASLGRNAFHLLKKIIRK